MNYIAHRRLKKDVICGHVNIPAMTELDCEGGVILLHGGIVCYDDSETAHQYFARNDDGHGMERGKLTQAIMNTLAQRKSVNDEDYQGRWDTVWNDHISQKYRRKDYENYWLWSHEFFNANIYDLRHIAGLIGAKSS